MIIALFKRNCFLSDVAYWPFQNELHVCNVLVLLVYVEVFSITDFCPCLNPACYVLEQIQIFTY